jgi:DUF4097 and DUF4098 domain-containing protein YvlB
MKKWMALLPVFPLCFVFLSAAQNHPRNGTVTLNDDSQSDDCAQHLRLYNDDYSATARDEEARTVPNQPLTIKAEHNGGIQVTNWDKPEISIKLCKQAAADDKATARKALNDTKLQINGNEITVAGPQADDDHSLATLLLVKAPKGATLDLTANNGGISVRSFNGTVKAHTHNGGIALKESTGTLSAEAQNGGISIKDCSGDVNANVQNGGLTISLPERWEGKGLEAHTHNGGLVIAVPRNLNTGVEIAGSQHVSFICKDDVCHNAQRTWDNDGRKLLRFGTGDPLVHATTVNGGIVVESRDHTRGEL